MPISLNLIVLVNIWNAMLRLAPDVCLLLGMASSHPNSQQPIKPTRIRTVEPAMGQKVLAVEGENVGLLAFTFGLLPLCSGLSLGGNRELPMGQASVIVCAYRNTPCPEHQLLRILVGCPGRRSWSSDGRPQQHSS